MLNTILAASYCIGSIIIGGLLIYRLNLHHEIRRRGEYSTSELRYGAICVTVLGTIFWSIGVIGLLAVCFAHGFEFAASRKQRKSLIERAVNKAMSENQRERDRRITALEKELGIS